MFDDEKGNDPERPKRMAKTANDLSDILDGQQKFYAKKAEEFGYARDVLRDFSKGIQNVPDNDSFFSAEHALNKFHAFAKVKAQEIKKVSFDVSSQVYSLGTVVVASSNMSRLQSNQSPQQRLSYPELPPSWPPTRRAINSAKFEKLDPEIGRLFRATWESFYGSSENPERIALGCMRQLFDHFFEILSPDIEVRSSSYFVIKDGDEPNQIHRKERISYAANTKLSDKTISESLEAQANQVLSLYRQLNKLHKRGRLDRNECEHILSALETILEQWINALFPDPQTNWSITTG